MSESDRSVLRMLYGGSTPDLDKLCACADGLSELGWVATYWLVRARLIGYRVERGAIVCEPCTGEVWSIDTPHRRIEVQDGEGKTIVSGGVTYYTNAIPQGVGDVSVV